VCDRILEARERGTLLRDQAVLIRANHHSALLELALSERARVPSTAGLLVECLRQNLVCTFRLADNPRRDRLVPRSNLDGVSATRRITEPRANSCGSRALVHGTHGRPVSRA
jgi:hypothetical protein